MAAGECATDRAATTALTWPHVVQLRMLGISLSLASTISTQQLTTRTLCGGYYRSKQSRLVNIRNHQFQMHSCQIAMVLYAETCTSHQRVAYQPNALTGQHRLTLAATNTKESWEPGVASL
jgi:hypothetical protein